MALRRRHIFHGLVGLKNAKHRERVLNNKLENLFHFLRKMIRFHGWGSGEVCADKIITHVYPFNHLGMILIVEWIDFENSLLAVINPTQNMDKGFGSVTVGG